MPKSEPNWDEFDPYTERVKNKTELRTQFRINYTGDGWYNITGIWIFVAQNLQDKQFHIMVWCADPRPLLRNILESEVRT